MSISNYSPVIITSDSSIPFIPSLLTIPTYPNLPIISSVNPIISFPLHPSLDLNKDRKLQEMMTKFFYYKTLDKWLKKEKDMLELLNYLRVTNGNVEVITPEQKNTQGNDNQQLIDTKVNFIEKNVLSKDDVYRILKKFVRETSTNWYDLEEKGTYFVKEIIKKFIKNKFKDVLENKRTNTRL